MSLNYRKDFRSVKKFKNDIKTGVAIEQEILKRWMKTENLNNVAIKTGSGDAGELLHDSEVDTKADYFIQQFGHIEIKFSLPKLEDFFHLKLNQVSSYLRQNCKILMVNGYKTDETKYTVIMPERVRELIKTAPIINWAGFGHKPCYRFYVKDFEWKVLC